MPADPIKAKHVKSMLNIHLSKQAFVRRTDEEDTGRIVWWDGSPFHKGDRPPLLPQFRYTCHIREHYGEEDTSHSYPIKDSVLLEDFNSIHEKCDNFTGRNFPGSVYEPELANLMDTLEWKHQNIDPAVVDTLTLPIAEGRRMNIFVPAFLELLKHLHDTERDFVVVIRTFGSDIPRIIPAFELIAQGRHPDLPIPGCICAPSAVGSLTRDTNVGEFTLALEAHASEGWTQIYKGSDSIVDYFENLSSKSVVMINDDYDTWRDNGFAPSFGKPMWLDLERSQLVRHILFDDNVNIDSTDSIACVWLRLKEGGWRPLHLDTKEGKATIGTVLLQASLYFSILKREAFVSELAKAETRFDTLALRLHQ